MTVINGATTGSSNILTISDLTGLANGDVLSATSTKMVVDTSPGPRVTFTGSGVSYSGGEPVSGIVNGIAIQEQGSSSSATWTGFSVSANTLWNDVMTANLSVLNTLLFNGNDTFTSHSAFMSNPTGVHADQFEGFNGNDIFNMQVSEGDEKVLGDAGNDVFNFGSDFTAKDIVNGGAGTDTLNLAGNYASGVTFGANTLLNVETIMLGATHSYKLIMNDATVASGATLRVDASRLAAANNLNFNGAAEKNGSFILKGGAGSDTLTGGAKADTIFGAAGADHLSGGAGGDHFVYTTASQSTGPNFDSVAGFDALSDKFDVTVKVTGINTALTTGALSTSTFNSNLVTDLNAAHLGAHHAVEFTPNSGTLQGDHFLVVDLNGVAGYQSNADLVIALTSPLNITHLATTDFI